MADTKSKIDDLQLVHLVLQHHPEAAQAVHAVQQVMAKATFPINSYHELADAMGGDHTTISLRGRTMSLAEIKKHVPAYYFPISNVHDLIAKMADLGGATPQVAGGHVVGVVHTGLGMPVTALPHSTPKPDSEPPQLAGEELAAKAGIHAKGQAGIGGIK